ncbi:MAG: IS4 family transposase [Pirellulaceae bacterium]|nr:IS4 family transposase [Pirellulaceae bacterium]
MFYSEFGSLQRRVAHARQADDLYFAALLPRETINESFGEARGILDRARIYVTSVTIWVFLSQVLSTHHGCVSAVAKLIAYRIALGWAACCAKTGAYCIARDKLDEQAMQRLLKHTGQAVEEQAPDDWLWLGHRVITADGTTVTMADTAENQAEYPQQRAQAPGCGFPIMRMVVFFALATGTVLETATGKWRGKLTHEVSLFREIDACIEEHDVFLADRAYAGWFDMARLMARGVHVVVRKHHMRKSDFRTGRRLRHDDHIIRLQKPQRPTWMEQDEYDGYRDFIEIREVRIRVQQKGFRTRQIIVHTSLLDDGEYSQGDIAALFRRRWQAELNLRSLKTVMQMEHLRCKKPHRVRNEVRAHLIAYNLIRQVMSEAAREAGVRPWQISFKATMSTLTDMLPVLGMIRDPAELCRVLLACCRQHTVGNRPDRYEPRVVKRRPKSYKLMQKPRHHYKPGEA